MKRERQVSVRRCENVPIIEFSGDLSDAIENELLSAYREVGLAGPLRILLVFDEDGTIYSSGIAVIIGLIREATPQGHTLYATGLSEHQSEVFELTGLTEFVQIFGSEEEAIARAQAEGN